MGSLIAACHRRMLRASALVFVLPIIAASAFAASPLGAQEKVDVATIVKIKTEEMSRSQVMDIMSWLSDVYGPRLTWSPNATRAKVWAMEQLKSWGLANVHEESWTGGGGTTSIAQGWENERFSFNATSPMPFIVEAVPQAWSGSTKGTVSGPAIIVEAGCSDELREKYAGKLKNAFIMAAPARNVPLAAFTPIATRLTDSALAAMAAAVPPTAGGAGGGNRGGGPGGRGGNPAPAPAVSPTCQQQAARDSVVAATAGRGGRGGGRGGLNVADTGVVRWLQAQGAAAILLGDAAHTGGDIGTNNGASRVPGAPQFPAVHVAQESYGRISRMLERKVAVRLELNMQNTFYPKNNTSFDIIGEIPGTDPALKDEVVMIGAHFDSWHSGTGATDNGAGSGVMLEAIRLLKVLNLQPRRTIRIGLWTGEEEGLLGSQAYTKAHFGTRDSAGFHPTDEQARFDTYFNLDNGSGKIRGIYIEGIEAERPIFAAWFKAFGDPGAQTITIRATTGTDHQSFVTANMGVGLPGFQFIQDPLDYGNFTHHTNQDVWERLQPDDMKFNAAMVASFAWQAAQRDEKLPRPPLPGPLPAGRGGRGGL